MSFEFSFAPLFVLPKQLQLALASRNAMIFLHCKLWNKHTKRAQSERALHSMMEKHNSALF